MYTHLHSYTHQYYYGESPFMSIKAMAENDNDKSLKFCQWKWPKNRLSSILIINEFSILNYGNFILVLFPILLLSKCPCVC